MYRSLAHYLERLEREGELVRVGVPVSTEYEIAEITDRLSKSAGGGPALLFENTGTDFPVLTNLMGSDRRIALALGVERLEEISTRIEELLKQATTPPDGLWGKLRMLPLLGEVSRWMPRTRSGRGVVQEVVWQGDEVDLGRLPILKCWACDGGPFVTLPMVNTVDPETGIRNVGMYRMQLFDHRTTGMHWHLHKTGARHYDAYKRLERKMPVTVALGGDPAYTYAATAPMPDNLDEYLLAGFLRRHPVTLVKSLTNDIYIPEDCDFVIEGYVDPAEEKALEGPFGDHTGFYSLTDYYPRFHVTAITHRRGAIWPATVVGVPPEEDAYIAKATETIFLAPIRLAVQPEVRDLWMPTEGTAHNLAVVSIDRRYEGQPRKVAQGLWGAGQMMFNKYLMVTPAACDIRSRDQLAALLRRVDPVRDIQFSEGILDVLDHATATTGYGGKALLDATRIDPLAPEKAISIPRSFEPVGGVQLVNTAFAERWSTLVLYADRSRPDEVDVAAYLDRNKIRGIHFVLLFDYAAAGAMTDADLLWLAAANTDPRRDATFHEGMLILDARSKRPGVGQNPTRFPNVATSHPDTIHRVDERWAEYGLGEFVPSPSRRYRKLWLSDEAQW